MTNWGTIQEAADYLSVSRDTVRRMISRDEITAQRIGPKLIRVDMDALDSLGGSISPDTSQEN